MTIAERRAFGKCPFSVGIESIRVGNSDPEYFARHRRRAHHHRTGICRPYFHPERCWRRWRGHSGARGIHAAAALWSSVFSNKVMIDLNVGFQALGKSVLGQTGSTSNDVSYTNVRSALTRDATSVDDRSAVASLAPTLSFMSNTPSGGVTNATTHILENNQANRDTQYLYVNTADQKALGLISAQSATTDASITFSSAFKWTFDASQGVAKGTYDFVGIAAHEIGHALGFVSGSISPTPTPMPARPASIRPRGAPRSICSATTPRAHATGL